MDNSPTSTQQELIHLLDNNREEEKEENNIGKGTPGRQQKGLARPKQLLQSSDITSPRRPWKANVLNLDIGKHKPNDEAADEPKNETSYPELNRRLMYPNNPAYFTIKKLNSSNTSRAHFDRMKQEIEKN